MAENIRNKKMEQSNKTRCTAEQIRAEYSMAEVSNDSQWLNNINELLPYYNTLIFDIWGVVHDGVNPYPGIVEDINTIIDSGKFVVFLSNTPRPNEGVIKKLRDFGILVDKTFVITSGDLVREQLTYFSDSVFKQLGHRCFHLGALRNKEILSGINIEVTADLKNADFILLTAYLDEGEDLNQFDAVFSEALKLGLSCICANPDTIIINGDKRRYCSGYFAEKYEKMGGKVYYYGKPYPAVYLKIFELLSRKGNLQDINNTNNTNRTNGTNDSNVIASKEFTHKNHENYINKRKIVMIGDTLETDILGAKNIGIDSALTLTGNTGLYLENARKMSGESVDKNDEASNMKYLKQRFLQEQISPTWIVRTLVP